MMKEDLESFTENAFNELVSLIENLISISVEEACSSTSLQKSRFLDCEQSSLQYSVCQKLIQMSLFNVLCSELSCSCKNCPLA